MLNKVQIIGRIGKDPELRYSQSNSAVCGLSVATDESYTDKNGQKVDRTEWHRVVTYGKTAENVNKFTGKGSLVYVEGKLRTRKWNDQSGAERYTTEIIADVVRFLSRKDKPQSEEPSYGLSEVEEPPF